MGVDTREAKFPNIGSLALIVVEQELAREIRNDRLRNTAKVGRYPV